MVRRGSTVRVRQRASLFSLLAQSAAGIAAHRQRMADAEGVIGELKNRGTAERAQRRGTPRTTSNSCSTARRSTANGSPTMPHRRRAGSQPRRGRSSRQPQRVRRPPGSRQSPPIAAAGLPCSSRPHLAPGTTRSRSTDQHRSSERLLGRAPKPRTDPQAANVGYASADATRSNNPELLPSHPRTAPQKPPNEFVGPTG